MATATKKTTNIKKTETAPVVENIVLNEENIDVAKQIEEAKAESVIATKTEKKKFAPDDGIECTSITSGELGMIGIKSGINYRWAERGDVTQVEYQDLVAAVRSNKSYIFKPLFIIKDDDFIAEFPQLNRAYSAMYSIRDLRDVLKMPAAQMKSTILSLPEGAKESIKNIAATMINNGSLDSIQKVKILDDIFDTKLMLLTELFNA